MKNLICILTLITFLTSCGNELNTIKSSPYTRNSSDSLLNTNNLTPVSAIPFNAIGIWKGYFSNAIKSTITINNDGTASIDTNSKLTVEKIGRGADGNYYLTDSRNNNIYRISGSTDGNALIFLNQNGQFIFIKNNFN